LAEVVSWGRTAKEIINILVTLGIMTRHLLAMPLLAKARIAQALYVRV
jgi:hypothetical protein